jgi:predicted kinase
MSDPLSKKHVLVVAGPSASGKSTLIAKLLADNDVTIQILGEIGLNVRASRRKMNTQRLVNKRKLRKNKTRNKSRIAIIHIDMLSSRREDRMKDLAYIAQVSRSFNVITLCTPHEVWFRRISERGKMNQIQIWVPGAFSYFSRNSPELSRRWRPSSFAWRIMIASTLSKYIGKVMYRLEYKSWEDFWVSQCGVCQYYFDSEREIFFPACPF